MIVERIIAVLLALYMGWYIVKSFRDLPKFLDEYKKQKQEDQNEET